MEFEEIFQRYFNDVYRYVRKLSNDESLAEDITSETFFKALKYIHQFRNECDIRIWLCQIAKHNYYSYLKKHKRLESEHESALENLIDPHRSVEDEIVNQEQVAQIKVLLETLPAVNKEVFMMRVFLELSFKAIGQRFGKTDNWACVTYYRTKTLLKNRWEAQYYEK